MIDDNRIKENLEIFSFPRLSGTEQEAKAFNILKKKVEALNLNPSVQRFSFSTFYARVYPKIASILTFWILLVLYLSFSESFVLINILIIILVYVPLFIITRKPENIRFGKVLNSQNLYLKIPTSLEETSAKKGNILIMSHIDSKGQRFTTIFRGMIFRFWIYSFIASFVFFILRGLFFPELIFLFYIIGALLLIINLISTIFILLNTTNNKSSGAIDDASGLACVLELLYYYNEPQNRLENYNVRFFFTGAEESGTTGIRHLYNEILKDFDRFNTIALNFDSIGKNPMIFSSAHEDHPHYHLYKKFFKDSKEFHAELNAKRPLISIARSDGSFLYHKGYKGMGFGDMNVYKYLHSIHDTLDKVDPLILKKLCLLITDFLQEIDTQT